MPANLPPEYQKAEAVYRSAATLPERIEALQEMLRVIPHHKGTDKLIAQHRRKLSQLREESDRRTATARKGSGVRIPREGAAQVLLVGMPNAGKSSLVARLTRAAPEVAPYPFTTLAPAPGMMPFLNISVQLIDTCAVTFEGARAWLPNLIRSGDALLLVVSLAGDAAGELGAVLEILEGWKIRPRGGEAPPPEAGNPGASPMREPSESPIRWGPMRGDPGAGFGPAPVPALVLANKRDAPGAAERLAALEAACRGRFPVHAVSAGSGEGLEDFKPALFALLRVCRVYTKSPGKPPDRDDPVVLPEGSTVEDFAGAIHKDLRRGLKFARIWGSAKFDGQKVTRGHVLRDEDVVELHA